MDSETIRNLQRVTEEVQQQSRLDALRDAEQALHRRLQREAEDRRVAQQLIERLDIIRANAASRGDGEAHVMDITYEGQPVAVDTLTYTVDPEMLTGPSAIVYRHALQHGYRPRLHARFERDPVHRAHRIAFCLSIPA